MENVVKNELIFVMVNQGFTDVIVEAAKSKGAKGATIINARGTSDPEAEQAYGVVITPDKELVFILVTSDIKEDVMNAIYKVAGIETKGMAIIGSVPAGNVVGAGRKPLVADNNAQDTKKIAK